jgi:hypothetical protein
MSKNDSELERRSYQGPELQSMAPFGFVKEITEHSWPVNISETTMWEWLNSVETFRDQQIWPYVVEFLDDKNPTEPRFIEGVLTNHYGPFLNAAGKITKIDHLKYRDLQYFYGSYVFSFRLVRPTRLEFFWDSRNQLLTMRLSSYIRPFFLPVWRFGQKLFWKRFGAWLSRDAKPKPQISS